MAISMPGVAASAAAFAAALVLVCPGDARRPPAGSTELQQFEPDDDGQLDPDLRRARARILRQQALELWWLPEGSVMLNRLFTEGHSYPQMGWP